MPEMRIKEVRLPELHLPEMSRDEISRVVGDATRDVDLKKLDPRRIDMPDIDLTKVDLSKIDIPKAVTAAAQAAGIVQRRRRPNGLVIAGTFVVLALIAFAVMTSPTVRPRLEEAARRIRARIDERRGIVDEIESSIDEVTDTSVIGVPIEPAAYRDEAPTASPFDDTISTVGQPATAYEDAPVAAGTISDPDAGSDITRG